METKAGMRSRTRAAWAQCTSHHGCVAAPKCTLFAQASLPFVYDFEKDNIEPLCISSSDVYFLLPSASVSFGGHRVLLSQSAFERVLQQLKVVDDEVFESNGQQGPRLNLFDALRV